MLLCLYLLFLCVLAVQPAFAFGFASSAAPSLASAMAHGAIGARRTYESHPLQMRHFGGIDRPSRRHKMSIQRLAPSNPPAISAEVLQNLQKLRIKNAALPNDVFSFSSLCSLR